MSYCNGAVNDFEWNIVQLAQAFNESDFNQAVFHLAYILRYFDPLAYHCYYATTETVGIFSEYLGLSSFNDIV